VIEDTLEDGPAVTVRFNRRGTLLAAGCSDGTIVVWDFDTRGVSRSLIGHVKTITSLSSVFIAALHQEKPVIIDFTNSVKRLPILQTGSNQEDSSEQNITTSSTGQTQWILVVTYDRQGKNIYTGSNRGQISVIDAETRALIREFRPTTSAIKNIQFSRKGKQIVVNANDRMIRLFEIKEDGPPEQIHKFQDLVNRIQWNQCCFSSDSDYVIGGSAHQAEHNIYIWDKIGGNLVKILEGPKEPLEDLSWHPIRPIVASVSSYGTIHIWATNYQENWSAFAPDFKELEENIDYEEREDEFDIVPEEEASKRKHDDEDVIVDVTTIEKINPFNDSDSEDGEEETFYLPLLPSDQQDEALLNNKHRHRRHQHHHRHHHGNSRHSHHRTNNHHNHTQDHGSGGLNHLHQHLKHENLGSESPSLSVRNSHIALDSANADSGVENSGAEDRRRDHRDRDREIDQDDDRDYDRERGRDHDRDRGRDRSMEGERDRERDRERERGHGRDHERDESEERHHKYKQRSDEEYDGHEYGYENGSANGNGYDRDHHHNNQHHHNQHSNNSARRRLEEQQSSVLDYEVDGNEKVTTSTR
ncbi:hypothetical protein BGX21_003648, partial [Mortierella sp. AD011]